MASRHSRSFFTFVLIALLLLVLGLAFWPRAIQVELGEVTRQDMQVTINEEGRTRVQDAYLVATPLAGRLLRVEVQPGDKVEKNNTLVAQMLPSNPAVLDTRSREQARYVLVAAEAAVRLAQAELNKALANQELAMSELKRTQKLRAKGSVSDADLDYALRTERTAQATVDAATAVVAMRYAELEHARTRLVNYDDQQRLNTAYATTDQPVKIPIKSPITGQVLRVIQQSEVTLPAGAPIMEIGNIENDLEVVTQLLSTDAVQVKAGATVLIKKWGGSGSLKGVVKRVEPWGFTKFSALGVEEQRVNVLIGFTSANPAEKGLGHGYRVEAQIVIWQQADTLVVPSSALFRNGKSWSVFLVKAGQARQQQVVIGKNNGQQAEVLSGLEVGDQVVLYPSSDLTDGQKVKQRLLN